MNLTFGKLISLAPDEVVYKLMENIMLRENPEYHPESNAYEHIKIVTNRLAKLHDIDLVLAAFFHDICKFESRVKREDSPYFLCKDHEKKGADFMLVHQEWVKSLGGNVDKIFFICWNHMRMKVFEEMGKKKQSLLRSSKFFDDLCMFASADNMGITNEEWEKSIEHLKPTEFDIVKINFKFWKARVKYKYFKK